MAGVNGGSPGRKIALVAVLFASLLPAAGFALRQRGEDAAVDRYLRAHDLAGLPVTQATAVRVARTVRADFVCDRAKWKSLDYAHRPFLRHETAWLLAAREGLCGEGTRVIVSLLQRLGFDATRVTLYDRRLQGVHTLVSIRLGGREILVDSINSADSVTQLLDRGDTSTRDFRVAGYSGDVLDRDAMTRALAERDTADADPLRARFFGAYRVYSYEALPMSKLLARAGLNWRVFNLSRPPAWMSVLAERPFAIMAVAALALAVVFDAVVLAWVVARRRARRRPAAHA